MSTRPAYEVVRESRPRGSYRGAVVGCGRMGSTIDDEHVGNAPLPLALGSRTSNDRGVRH